MDHQLLIQVWRDLSAAPGHAQTAGAWALFEHGTRVTLPEPEADPAAQAAALLDQFGRVQIGTNTADFNVFPLENGLGWLVTCYHPQIVTYVGREEAAPHTDEIFAGLMGRSKRAQDAEERRVIHVELP